MDYSLQFLMVRCFILSLLLLACLVPQWFCDTSSKEAASTNEKQDKQKEEVKGEVADTLPVENKAASNKDPSIDLGQPVEAHVKNSQEQDNLESSETMTKQLESVEPKEDVLPSDSDSVKKTRDISNEAEENISKTSHENEEKLKNTTPDSKLDAEKEPQHIDRPCFPEDQVVEEERMKKEIESTKQEPEVTEHKVEDVPEERKTEEKSGDEEVVTAKVSKEEEKTQKVRKEEEKTEIVQEEEHIPSFDEWKKKKMAEQEQGRKQVLVASSHQDRGIGPGGQGSSATQQRQFSLNQNSKNHASADCGAKILGANSEAQSTSAILMQNRDVYMLNPCSAKIWLTVELCEPIQIKHIEIANFELFSSTPESFRVYTSDRYPTREWHVLGTFHAKDVRTLQSFSIQDQQMFTKYLKVEMLSFFGSEHYCPISILRVFGTSMEEEIIEDSESSSGSNEAEVDTDLIAEDDLIAGEGLKKTNIIAGAIANAVNNIVKHAAKVFTGSEDSKKSPSCGENLTDKDLQELRPCFPEDDPNITNKNPPDEPGCGQDVPAIRTDVDLNKNRISAEVRSSQKQPSFQQKLYEMCDPCTYCQKCDYSEYLPLCNYVRYMKGMYSMTCKDFTVKTPSSQHTKQTTMKEKDKVKKDKVEKKSDNSGQQTCHESHCDQSVTEKKVTETKTSHTSDQSEDLKDKTEKKENNIDDAKPPDIVIEEVTEKKQDEKMPINKSDEQADAEKANAEPVSVERSINKTELKNEISESKLDTAKVDMDQTESHSTKPNGAKPPETLQTFTTTPENKESPTDKITATHQEDSVKSEKSPVTDSGESDKNKVIHVAKPENGSKIVPQEALTNNEVTDSGSKSTELQTEKDTGNGIQSDQNKGSGGSSVPANKESIFMRLNNRIKNLEYNMSLSQQYLQELSQKYRKQMEDMQKNFNKTINKLSETSKQAEQQDQRQQAAISNLEGQLARLTNVVENVSKEMNLMQKQMIERHFFLMILEVVFLSFLFLVCTTKHQRVPHHLDHELQMAITSASNPKKKIERRNSSDGTVGHKKMEMNTVKWKHHDDRDVKITGDYSDLLIVEPTKPLLDVLHKSGDKEFVKQHGSKKHKSKQKTRDRAGSASSFSHFEEIKPYNNHISSESGSNISSAGLLFDGQTDLAGNINGNRTSGVLCNGKHIPRSKTSHHFDHVETLYEAHGTANTGKGYARVSPPSQSSKQRKHTHNKKDRLPHFI
ncbi:SUN domain-containing ossification factor-like isoform X2 [Ptychodera flava]|uniref:SUN domain-containing ossification factor-like isoform X2 n=1 Tax=Ptychodera flava TaxID=63121 RepID=UPI003969F550